jgi:hypothetical protein
MNEITNLCRFGTVLVTTCASLALAQAAVPNDACGLLNQAQVSAALGVDVEAGQHPVQSDRMSCNWREHGKPEGPARNVIVYILDAQKFEAGKTRVAHTPSALQSGLGDDAYYFRPGRLPVTLTVKKGDFYFRIMTRSDATRPADDQDKAIDKTLALDALKKL